MTRTEKFVSELYKDTFLSFWSFPNPVGKSNKELCDILVVCEPDIIIFSIKEIFVKENGNIDKVGGLKGGITRGTKLSSKRKKEIAKKAAKKRWSKKD